MNKPPSRATTNIICHSLRVLVCSMLFCVKRFSIIRKNTMSTARHPNVPPSRYLHLNSTVFGFVTRLGKSRNCLSIRTNPTFEWCRQVFVTDRSFLNKRISNTRLRMRNSDQTPQVWPEQRTSVSAFNLPPVVCLVRVFIAASYVDPAVAGVIVAACSTP